MTINQKRWSLAAIVAALVVALLFSGMGAAQSSPKPIAGGDQTVSTMQVGVSEYGEPAEFRTSERRLAPRKNKTKSTLSVFITGYGKAANWRGAAVRVTPDGVAKGTEPKTVKVKDGERIVTKYAKGNTGCRRVTAMNTETTLTGNDIMGRFFTFTDYCWNLKKDKLTKVKTGNYMRSLDSFYKYSQTITDKWSRDSVKWGKVRGVHDLFIGENCVPVEGCLWSLYTTNRIDVSSTGVARLFNDKDAEGPRYD